LNSGFAAYPITKMSSSDDAITISIQVLKALFPNLIGYSIGGAFKSRASILSR